MRFSKCDHGKSQDNPRRNEFGDCKKKIEAYILPDLGYKPVFTI